MTFVQHTARIIAAAAIIASATAHAQSTIPIRVRGEITAIDATTLTVRHSSGESVTLMIAPNLTVGAVKNVKLGEIEKGAFVGTATKLSSEGTLVAVEVLVFPEAARGSGEGHYAWDLLPGSMMTNANVDTVMAGVHGRTLRLSYKGGEKEVVVPENTPVVTPTPATRTDLIVGKKVFVVAKDTSPQMTAMRVIVEKDGVAPPM